MKNSTIRFRWLFILLVAAIGCCLFYNGYTLFFPIDTALESDAAEHLHAAYLLRIGERPYLDFIQNHPMLFHHYLNWMEKLFDISSIRKLALAGRAAVFAHFILCATVFCLWTSQTLKNRIGRWPLAMMIVCAWAMLDIYNPEFHWVWDLRPDFICYGQTLLGLFLIHRWIEKAPGPYISGSFLGAVLGGCLIGFGNAVIPKGIPFIGAYAMTFVFMGGIQQPNFDLSWFSKKRVIGLLVIAGGVALSFAAWMIIDCHLSNVPPRKWFAAVFLLNSRKHIIFSNSENNPITHILNIFSIPFPLAILLMGWVAFELVFLLKNKPFQKGQTSIWLFSTFTILINAILPTYSNGVVWGYYFIPSIFAAAAISLMLLSRLRHYSVTHPFSGSLTIPNGIVLLLTCFILFQILNTPFHSLTQHTARRASAREVANISPTDFINDEILPREFVYLGYPDRMPIKSRSWGYYFMLAHSTDFWKDCYTLGLGPDPTTEWDKKVFSDNPPEAITFTKQDELSDFIFIVQKCHGIDISWLQDQIQDRYVLMTRPGASLYVLNENISKFESLGWRRSLSRP